MRHADTMKLGFVGFVYQPPQTITDQIERIKWQTAKVNELGGSVFHQGGMPLLPDDQGKLDELKAHIDSVGVELELGCPYIFGLTGNESAKTRADLAKQIKKAQFLGIKIMRAGYGKMNVVSSRYNKDYPLKEHIDFVVKNLIEAGKIFEDAGIHFALENHCDFLGSEFVDIFTRVNSKFVGCALDTANGFAVFNDANKEVEELAPFAFTTHIKDMVILDNDPASGFVPLQAWGCPLGEGNVDIPRALEILDSKSPMASGLHLIVEQSWMKFDDRITDRDLYAKESIHKSMKYLKKLLGRT
ncbi:MAG: sugar phosphate isomerase/epimerase [Treponema sp.]|jgi:sugar phosphate isomerase/epimerase|nr:sugar phosphate isomerase/epimerase [Treponema sp.]